MICVGVGCWLAYLVIKKLIFKMIDFVFHVYEENAKKYRIKAVSWIDLYSISHETEQKRIIFGFDNRRYSRYIGV